jgi:bifunctional DNA-binding transcriptional regulator/antitoxin component of YhaV-PrlF toxin-antitoxin module
MPAVKIGPKHQITIPKEVFDALDLSPEKCATCN